MRSFFRIFILLLVISSGVEMRAQSRIIDSLKLALKNAKHDTTRCSILVAMVEADDDIDSWQPLNEQLLLICDKNINAGILTKSFLTYRANGLNNEGFLLVNKGKNSEAMPLLERSATLLDSLGKEKDASSAYANIGNIYITVGKPLLAEKYFLKTLHYGKKYNNDELMGIAFNGLGFINENTGHIKTALDYYQKGLVIRERSGDKKRTATSYNNIGLLYLRQGDEEAAMKYLNISLHLREEIGDSLSLAESLNNLGVLFQGNKNYEKAREVIERGLAVKLALNDKKGAAYCYNNLGAVYERMNMDDRSEACHQMALKLRREINDRSNLASTLKNLASVYAKKKDLVKASKYANEAIAVAKEVGSPEQIRNVSEFLFKFYKFKNDHKAALEMFELFISMRDSIQNNETKKASIKSQLKYEYEKQAAADSVAHAKESQIKSAELSRQSAEIKVKRNQQYALFGGLFLVILFAIFMFNRFKVTQKQKLIIEEQKSVVEGQKLLVEEKQKEILDSIHYAKRIQLAQIPTVKRVSQILTRLKAHEA